MPEVDLSRIDVPRVDTQEGASGGGRGGPRPMPAMPGDDLATLAAALDIQKAAYAEMKAAYGDAAGRLAAARGPSGRLAVALQGSPLAGVVEELLEVLDAGGQGGARQAPPPREQATEDIRKAHAREALLEEQLARAIAQLEALRGAQEHAQELGAVNVRLEAELAEAQRVIASLTVPSRTFSPSPDRICRRCSALEEDARESEDRLLALRNVVAKGVDEVCGRAEREALWWRMRVEALEAARQEQLEEHALTESVLCTDLEHASIHALQVQAQADAAAVESHRNARLHRDAAAEKDRRIAALEADVCALKESAQRLTQRAVEAEALADASQLEFAAARERQRTDREAECVQYAEAVRVAEDEARALRSSAAEDARALERHRQTICGLQRETDVLNATLQEHAALDEETRRQRDEAVEEAAALKDALRAEGARATTEADALRARFADVLTERELELDARAEQLTACHQQLADARTAAQSSERKYETARAAAAAAEEALAAAGARLEDAARETAATEAQHTLQRDRAEALSTTAGGLQTRLAAKEEECEAAQAELAKEIARREVIDTALRQGYAARHKERLAGQTARAEEVALLRESERGLQAALKHAQQRLTEAEERAGRHEAALSDAEARAADAVTRLSESHRAAAAAQEQVREEHAAALAAAETAAVEAADAAGRTAVGPFEARLAAKEAECEVVRSELRREAVRHAEAAQAARAAQRAVEGFAVVQARCLELEEEAQARRTAQWDMQDTQQVATDALRREVLAAQKAHAEEADALRATNQQLQHEMARIERGAVAAHEAAERWEARCGALTANPTLSELEHTQQRLAAAEQRAQQLEAAAKDAADHAATAAAGEARARSAVADAEAASEAVEQREAAAAERCRALQEEVWKGRAERDRLQAAHELRVQGMEDAAQQARAEHSRATAALTAEVERLRRPDDVAAALTVHYDALVAELRDDAKLAKEQYYAAAGAAAAQQRENDAQTACLEGQLDTAQARVRELDAEVRVAEGKADALRAQHESLSLELSLHASRRQEREAAHEAEMLRLRHAVDTAEAAHARDKDLLQYYHSKDAACSDTRGAATAAAASPALPPDGSPTLGVVEGMVDEALRAFGSATAPPPVTTATPDGFVAERAALVRVVETLRADCEAEKARAQGLATALDDAMFRLRRVAVCTQDVGVSVNTTAVPGCDGDEYLTLVGYNLERIDRGCNTLPDPTGELCHTSALPGAPPERVLQSVLVPDTPYPPMPATPCPSMRTLLDTTTRDTAQQTATPTRGSGATLSPAPYPTTSMRPPDEAFRQDEVAELQARVLALEAVVARKLDEVRGLEAQLAEYAQPPVMVDSAALATRPVDAIAHAAVAAGGEALHALFQDGARVEPPAAPRGHAPDLAPAVIRELQAAVPGAEVDAAVTALLREVVTLRAAETVAPFVAATVRGTLRQGVQGAALDATLLGLVDEVTSLRGTAAAHSAELARLATERDEATKLLGTAVSPQVCGGVVVSSPPRLALSSLPVNTPRSGRARRKPLNSPPRAASPDAGLEGVPLAGLQLPAPAVDARDGAVVVEDEAALTTLHHLLAEKDTQLARMAEACAAEREQHADVVRGLVAASLMTQQQQEQREDLSPPSPPSPPLKKQSRHDSPPPPAADQAALAAACAAKDDEIARLHALLLARTSTSTAPGTPATLPPPAPPLPLDAEALPLPAAPLPTPWSPPTKAAAPLPWVPRDATATMGFPPPCTPAAAWHGSPSTPPASRPDFTALAAEAAALRSAVASKEAVLVEALAARVELEGTLRQCTADADALRAEVDRRGALIEALEGREAGPGVPCSAWLRHDAAALTMQLERIREGLEAVKANMTDEAAAARKGRGAGTPQVQAARRAKTLGEIVGRGANAVGCLAVEVAVVQEILRKAAAADTRVGARIEELEAAADTAAARAMELETELVAAAADAAAARAAWGEVTGQNTVLQDALQQARDAAAEHTADRARVAALESELEMQCCTADALVADARHARAAAEGLAVEKAALQEDVQRKCEVIAVLEAAAGRVAEAEEHAAATATEAVGLLEARVAEQERALQDCRAEAADAARAHDLEAASALAAVTRDRDAHRERVGDLEALAGRLQEEVAAKGAGAAALQRDLQDVLAKVSRHSDEHRRVTSALAHAQDRIAQLECDLAAACAGRRASPEAVHAHAHRPRSGRASPVREPPGLLESDECA